MIRRLFMWSTNQSLTHRYEGVNVRNFSTSWIDGLAFNAVLHSFRSDLFNYHDLLSPQRTPHANLWHAFSLAKTHFGVEPLLEPDDIILRWGRRNVSVAKQLFCSILFFDEWILLLFFTDLTKNRYSSTRAVYTLIYTNWRQQTPWMTIRKRCRTCSPGWWPV